MTAQEEDIEDLAAIGLTRAQAKVYLALVSLRKANARTVWKNSGVARQEIYRLLTELQEKSLVEKIVAAPTEFRAVPMQDALATLLKRKVNECEEIEKKTRELLDRFRANHQENMTDEEGEFTLITTKDANVCRINEAAINVKKSVDIIDSWDSFNYAIVVYVEQIIKSAKRNVKFRFITDKPKDGETVPKFFQTWKKNGWAELRYIPTRPSASIRIEDGKQVTLCITAAEHTLEAPSLFSDNPCLVAVLQEYFDLKWSKATEDNT
jgi:sugar-specific transcriptional regulator TrmB